MTARVSLPQGGKAWERGRRWQRRKRCLMRAPLPGPSPPRSGLPDRGRSDRISGRPEIRGEGTVGLRRGVFGRGGSLLGPIGLLARGRLVAPVISQRVVVLATSPGRAHLDVLREHAEAGRLTPVIDRTYPLCEVPEAIRYLESEHARAKVVITV